MQRMSRQPQALASCAKCGARTRSGLTCQAPAVVGRQRCRMHGGARGSGAPHGDRNGSYRHGEASKTAVTQRAEIRSLMKMIRSTLDSVD